MAWSADNEYRTRVMSRRRSVVQLRRPALAYGPAALILMYATGLLTVFWFATGFSSVDGTSAGDLAWPTGIAVALTALGVGLPLLRYEASSVTAMVGRIGMIWACVGAAWPVLLMGIDLMAAPAHNAGLARLASAFAGVTTPAFGGGVIGGLGGLVGGAIATLLCVERAR